MLARLYDTHHNLHLEDLPFWLEIAAQANGPILELGCGTGRVLVPLAQAGRHVLGLDRDPTMLAILSARLTQSLREYAAVIQADFTRFHLARRFRLVMMPCNTYSTLSRPERRFVLECVYQHLEPGGIFATSAPNPLLLRQLPPSAEPEVEEIFPHPQDGEPVQVSSSWQRSRQVFTLHWHYDHLLPDGRIQRWSAQVAHYLTPVETYLSEFQMAGFRSVERFGGFDYSAFTASSDDLILLARR